MPHFTTVIENLSRKLMPVSEVQNADAAVALLLKPANQSFKILLVKRAEKFSDPWSGQMAFPGGKRDPKDRDTMQTVIRETLEETNINITHCCRFLGVLENMRSTVRPKLLVAPFVILLEHEPVIVLNEELELCLWIFLEKLWECRGIAKLAFREVPAYIVEENAIWGLTYRILEKFSRFFEPAAT